MPKVALVADIPNWAFHRIAKNIKMSLSNQFSADIFFAKDENLRQLHEYLDSKYDLVHYFWRLIPIQINAKKTSKTKITTSIYDHTDLDNRSLHLALRNSVHGITCSSDMILQVYESSTQLNNILIKKCEDGVDSKLFGTIRPTDAGREKLTAMWVGNSTWGIDDHKGLNTIILPAIQQLISKNLPVSLNIVDGSKIKLSHSQLLEEYSKSDFYICASRSEGTPNPVLEAAASGRAWISTRVGIVPEFTTAAQEAFIIERSVEHLVNRIAFLLNNRNLLISMGKENQAKAKEWDWSVKVRKFEKFFTQILDE